MTARVVDLAKHSRRTPSPNGRAANGHVPAALVPMIPTLSIDFVSLASQRRRAGEIPATAEGRVYVLVNADDTWTVKVTRAGDKHGLLLEGTEAASAPVIMRQIICWLFGVPA